MPDGPKALDLLRSIGLTPDGPVPWGAPVRSRTSGVFLVELSTPASPAPLDETVVRNWIERVPTLLLDDARPTPRALADRLAGYWLPRQTVVYVGRTSKTLSARVAALYSTPLGDRRPHPGGHWLKTLRGLERTRLWWAETDAPEETEDALMGVIGVDAAVGGLPPLVDGGPVLPWANLETVTGERRVTGITGSLRADADPGGAASSAGRTSSTPATRKAPTRPGARPTRATVRRSSKAAGSAQAPPPTRLTPEGLAGLTAELEELRMVRRPEVILRVKHARELGDLRENADYEAARNEQSFLEGRIRAVEQALKTAVVIEAATTGHVALGSTLVVEVEGETETLRIVGSTEADPTSGRISDVSPVGRALIGRRAGDEVVIRTPGHEVHYRVIEVG